jgi:hypothetical protein
MNSINYEESSYIHDVDLLITSYYLFCVEYATRSGCREKSVHIRPAYLKHVGRIWKDQVVAYLNQGPKFRHLRFSSASNNIGGAMAVVDLANYSLCKQHMQIMAPPRLPWCFEV